MEKKHINGVYLFLTCSLLFWHVESYQLMCLQQCVCAHNFTEVKCSRFINSITNIDNLFSPEIRELHILGSYLGPVFNTSFSRFTELEILDLSENQIQKISDLTFVNLKKLKQLSLKGNRLTTLEDRTFAFLEKLEVLDLSHNGFSEMPDAVFRYLDNLRVLNISFNQLKTPTLGLRFQVMTKMEVLDFSGNKFSHIKNDTFEMAHSWEDHSRKLINLSSCGIKSIQNGTFRYPVGLKSLIISGNKDISLDDLAVILNSSDLNEVSSLDISGMNLQNITNILPGLQQMSLRELFLSDNNLTELPSHFPHYIRSLDKLSLDHNSLSSVASEITELRGLTYLDLSHNNVSTVDNSLSENLINLKTLHLANNRIGDGMISVINMVALDSLDLSYNMFNNFNIPKSLSNLKTLKLAGNKLKTIKALLGLKKLEYFDLSNNMVSELGAFLFPDSPNILLVNFSRNSISRINHQTFKPNTPKFIDLSYNSLQKVWNMGWKGTLSISLQGNQISDVDRHTFYGLYSLTDLDLSKNKLKQLQSECFVYLTNLTNLHLAENQLSDSLELSKSFFSLEDIQLADISQNNFTKLEITMFKDNPKLRQVLMPRNQLPTVNPVIFQRIKSLEAVDLSDNPFVCDCDMVDLSNWMKKTKVKVIHVSNTTYQCHGAHSGKWIMEYEPELFECRQLLLYIIIFSSIGGLLVIVGIISGLVCHYFHKWKRRGKHYRKHNDNEDEKFIPNGHVLTSDLERKHKTSNGHVPRSKKIDDIHKEMMAREKVKQRRLENKINTELMAIQKAANKSRHKTSHNADRTKRSRHCKTGRRDNRRHSDTDGLGNQLKEVRFHTLQSQSYQPSLATNSSHSDNNSRRGSYQVVPFVPEGYRLQPNPNVFFNRRNLKGQQRNYDIVRIPDSRLVNSRSVPDFVNYLDSGPRPRYPLTPTVMVTDAEDNRRLVSIDARERRRGSVDDLGPIRHEAFYGRGNVIHAPIPVYGRNDRFNTISGRRSSSRDGRSAEWI